MFDSVSYIYILYYSYPDIIMWLIMAIHTKIVGMYDIPARNGLIDSIHPSSFHLFAPKKQSNMYLFFRIDGHMTALYYLVTF